MRGSKKARTIAKLDRDNTLPFSITAEQKFLYDQDDYKYLIHLMRVFPNDEFMILQYLIVKFHPLVIKTCHKFNRKINIDWLDLIGFARHCFIELVYRFDLNSTLYFKMYISLALPRAINDYYVYDKRRTSLNQATRLDELPQGSREALIEANYDIYGCDERTEQQDLKLELVEFINSQSIPPIDKKVFADFASNIDLNTIAKKHALPLSTVKTITASCSQMAKEYYYSNLH